MADSFAAAMRSTDATCTALAVADARTTASAVVDWGGLPLRVVGCGSRAQALGLLDWTAASGGLGGRSLQEEYVEWRVVRRGQRITRIELTTELAAYWRVLAAHEPEMLLALASDFARSDTEAWELYGDYDPFGAAATARGRASAFADAMLGPRPGPLNNGKLAICCMVQRSNTLEALASLAVAAASGRSLVAGGRRRCLSAAEVMPSLSGAAVAGRGSDPILVERLGRIAFEGRLVAFDDPLGIYIAGAQLDRLRGPDGEPIPREWLSLSRGVSAAQAADGRARFQRAVLEVPAGEGYTVDALVDTATEQPIRFGGQIAELLQLVVILRLSEPRGFEGPSPPSVTAIEHAPEGVDCVDVAELARAREREATVPDDAGDSRR